MKVEKNLLNSNTSYTKTIFRFTFDDCIQLVENIVNIPQYTLLAYRNLLTNFSV